MLVVANGGGKEGTAQQAVPMNAAPIPTSESMAAAARATACSSRDHLSIGTADFDFESK